MKKFNLKEALEGKPVVTRKGEKVTQLTLFKMDSHYPLIGVLNNKRFSFTENGMFDAKNECEFDLFMATEKKSVWINVYEDYFSDEFTLGKQHKTLERATNNIRGNINYIKTIEITNEI
jgi:hypothetical protein